MSKQSKKSGKKKKRKPQETFFRVVVTYDNGETSGHKLFNDRKLAEKRAQRLRMLGLIKKVEIEEVTSTLHSWRSRPGLKFGARNRK